MASQAWYSPAQEFYMGEEEVRDNKAKILLECSENEKQLKQWRDRASEVASNLHILANRLEGQPEQVVFSGERTPLEFQSTQLLVMQDVALDEVLRVRDNIRQLELRRRQLHRSQEAFGL
jgi:hypothetical protein